MQGVLYIFELSFHFAFIGGWALLCNLRPAVLYCSTNESHQLRLPLRQRPVACLQLPLPPPDLPVPLGQLPLQAGVARAAALQLATTVGLQGLLGGGRKKNNKIRLMAKEARQSWVLQFSPKLALQQTEFNSWSKKARQLWVLQFSPKLAILQKRI